jgi:nucleoid DNA-binding protein
MTEHHWRAPAGVRALGRVLNSEETWPTAGGMRNSAQAPDLFAGASGNDYQIAPHPTFEARAAIWRDQANGLISLAEAQRRSAAIGSPQTRAMASHVRSPAPARPRHTRPAPNASRQYSGTMATTAARDDRLTPNAKAMLQVIRARCGKGRETSTCKATLGSIMSRSARTIRRYLVDLVRWGYLEIETRRTARGLHTGLIIRVTEKTLPFFAEAKGLARWLAETAPFNPFAASMPAEPRVTKLRPKNEFQKNPFTEVKDSALRRVSGRPPIPI